MLRDSHIPFYSSLQSLLHSYLPQKSSISVSNPSTKIFLAEYENLQNHSPWDPPESSVPFLISSFYAPSGSTMMSLRSSLVSLLEGITDDRLFSVIKLLETWNRIIASESIQEVFPAPHGVWPTNISISLVLATWITFNFISNQSNALLAHLSKLFHSNDPFCRSISEVRMLTYVHLMGLVWFSDSSSINTHGTKNIQHGSH